MATFISHSPEETLALGEQWGLQARPGWLIGLTGELGAGKTQLVKGIARGLQIPRRIQSPTFNLVNLYAEGRLPLAHLDLYRLESKQQILQAGLDEYLFKPSGVTVVEWAERWPEFGDTRAPAGVRRVHLAALSETVRRIEYDDLGD